MRNRLLPELRRRDRIAHLLPLVRHRADAGGPGLREEASSYMESMGKKFRQLLQDEPYLFTGGIYSPLDARSPSARG